MELESLIKKAQGGDKDAFGEIYELFYKKIWRFIYYHILDKEQAADLTQDTFIKAWKALPGFDANKGSLQSYIFAIARNLVIDESSSSKKSLEDVIETTKKVREENRQGSDKKENKDGGKSQEKGSSSHSGSD